jgi:hypothetical protein
MLGVGGRRDLWRLFGRKEEEEEERKENKGWDQSERPEIKIRSQTPSNRTRTIPVIGTHKA